MDKTLDTSALRLVSQEKLKDLLKQQENLKVIEAELSKINSKINKKEELTIDDTKFIGNLGWLTALSVSIAAVAASL
jgi:deoxyhypusine synthase